MIVDYANVFASLEKALAIYGKGTGGDGPVKDKKKLVEELRTAVDAVTTFCANQQVILPAIEQLPAGDMRRLERVDDAVNALISPDALRKDFLAQEKLVATQLLVLDWRRRRDARARVRLAIEDALDAGLPPVYPPDLYQRKVVAVFEHVYESYADQSSSFFRATV